MSLLWFFPVACLVVFCGGYVLLGTNVTRLQYDAALSKWRSQTIREYEATVSATGMFRAGEYQLRVLDGQVVSASRMTSAGPVVFGDTSADFLDRLLSRMTVEGMFSRVDELTARSPFNLESGCLVGFDGVLGYPSLIECHPKPWYDVTDSDISTQITSLKVLQRATPAPNP